jgi:hypothetical protein
VRQQLALANEMRRWQQLRERVGSHLILAAGLLLLCGSLALMVPEHAKGRWLQDAYPKTGGRHP